MKKFLALALALVMTLALAACGGGDGQKDGGAASGAIKIGGVGPLTGDAAIYGNAAKGGAEIAVEEINALGGLQFDLHYEDDANDPEKSVNAYNTLKDWGMQVFLGSVTSTPGVATAAESNADHKLLMLDEPSMGLAPILVEQIFDIIKELHAAGTTILLVEQNAQAALSVADRAYVLETGRISLSGTGAELMASDKVQKAYLGG